MPTTGSKKSETFATFIAFTPDEAKEFARRCWAYELFLRAGSPHGPKTLQGSMPM